MTGMGFEGVGVVVTGASRGLGAAVAEVLVNGGAKVALVARGGEALEALASRLRRGGGVAHAIVGDVAAKGDVHAIAGTAAALLGRVDVVVNAASSLGPTPLPLLGDLACEDLQHVLETNVVGPFRLFKALAGPMVVRGRGLLVQVSSDAAVNAYSRWGAYAASKAAMDVLTRTWAAELEGTGVRFLSVDPGEMDTTMHAAAMPEADPSTLARPEVVATTLAAMMRDAAIPSGARLEASTWRPS